MFAPCLLNAIVLICVAFIPPIIYVIWIRNIERYEREPYARVALVFIYGMTFSIIFAAILEYVIIKQFADDILSRGVIERLGKDLRREDRYLIFVAVIVAPFVEEFTKALGIRYARNFINEVEDGIVYGAAVGLGFAATENLLYEYSALQESFLIFLMTAIVRSIASALMHASATAVTGYGVGKALAGRSSLFVIFPYYIIAVIMHGTFNLFAVFGVIFADRFPLAPFLGLFMAIALALAAFEFVRDKIRELDLRLTYTPPKRYY